MRACPECNFECAPLDKECDNCGADCTPEACNTFECGCPLPYHDHDCPEYSPAIEREQYLADRADYLNDSRY